MWRHEGCAATCSSQPAPPAARASFHSTRQRHHQALVPSQPNANHPPGPPDSLILQHHSSVTLTFCVSSTATTLFWHCSLFGPLCTNTTFACTAPVGMPLLPLFTVIIRAKSR